MSTTTSRLTAASLLGILLLAGAAAAGTPRQALDELRETTGLPWRATWDASTGLPTTLDGGVSWAYPGTARQAAEAFVEDNTTLLGVDLRGVSMDFVREERLDDVTQVTFVRSRDGVNESRVTFEVTGHGRVRSMQASVWTVERSGNAALPDRAFFIAAEARSGRRVAPERPAAPPAGRIEADAVGEL